MALVLLWTSVVFGQFHLTPCPRRLDFEAITVFVYCIVRGLRKIKLHEDKYIRLLRYDPQCLESHVSLENCAQFSLHCPGNRSVL